MEKRNLALIIIALCVFSLIIGVVNSVLKPLGVVKNQSVSKQRNLNGWLSQTGNKLALIILEGPIVYEHSTGFIKNYYSADNVKDALDRAYKDPSVKGVLIQANTPGGTVAMSQEIYNSLIKLRKKKPVVVSMMDVVASGGYYIASAADRIYAQPGTLTGSIGVIFNNFNAQELLNDKLGVKTNVIKSGKFKDIGSPYRNMSASEQDLLQDIVNDTYEQFVSAIKNGRVDRNDNYKIEKTNLTVENLRKYADGRIFTGEQAKKLGFVDKLGGLNEAEADLNKMATAKFQLTGKLPLVKYNSPSGFGEFFLGIQQSFLGERDFLYSLLPLSTKYHHKLLYVWE